MKYIYTKSFYKYVEANEGVLARTLCDGCGKSMIADLPDIMKQEQGEKDIYCDECKSEINMIN